MKKIQNESNENNYIYVSSISSSNNPDGSIDNPFDNIQQAINEAKRESSEAVCLDEGVFEISTPIVMADGISLLGGYSRKNDWDRNIHVHKTIIEMSGDGDTNVVVASGLTKVSSLDGITIREKDGNKSSLKGCVSVTNSKYFHITNNDLSLTGSHRTFSFYGILILGDNKSLIKNNKISVQPAGFLRYSYGVLLKKGKFTTTFINNCIDVGYLVINNDNFAIGINDSSDNTYDIVLRNNTIRLGYCKKISAIVGVTYYSSAKPVLNLTVENNIFFAVPNPHSQDQSQFAIYTKSKEWNINSFSHNNIFQMGGILNAPASNILINTVAEMEAQLGNSSINNESLDLVKGTNSYFKDENSDWHLTDNEDDTYQVIRSSGINGKIHNWGFDDDLEGNPRRGNWSMGAYQMAGGSQTEYFSNHHTRLLIAHSENKSYGVNVTVGSERYDLELFRYWGGPWSVEPASLKKGTYRTFNLLDNDRGGICFRVIDPDTKDEVGFASMSFTCPMLSDNAAEGSSSNPTRKLVNAGLQKYKTTGHPLNVSYNVGQPNAAYWKSGTEYRRSVECDQTDMLDASAFITFSNPRSLNLELVKVKPSDENYWYKTPDSTDVPPPNCKRTMVLRNYRDRAGVIFRVLNSNGADQEGFISTSFTCPYMSSNSAEGSVTNPERLLLSAGLQKYSESGTPAYFEYHLGEESLACWDSGTDNNNTIRIEDTYFSNARSIIRVMNTLRKPLTIKNSWVGDVDKYNQDHNFVTAPRGSIPAGGTRYYILNTSDRGGLCFMQGKSEFHLSFTCPYFSSNSAEGSAMAGLQSYEPHGAPATFTYMIGTDNLASWNDSKYDNGEIVCDETRVRKPPHIQHDLADLIRLKTYNFDVSGLLGLLNVTSSEINDISILSVPESESAPVDNYLKTFEDMLLNAQEQITISTLWITEGGKQENILKRAIKRMNERASEQNPMRLRILWSMTEDYKNTANWSWTLGKFLIDDLELNPNFSIAFYRFNLMEGLDFNHSKVVAVDSSKLLVGGINFVNEHYDSGRDGVHDVSLYIDKDGAANLGHSYITRVLTNKDDIPNWCLFGQNGDIHTYHSFTYWFYTGFQRVYKEFIQLFTDGGNTDEVAERNTIGDYILGVGKCQNSEDRLNVGRLALISLLDIAETEINIAQQSIASIDFSHHFYDIGERICEAVGRALNRGVRVNIVLSGTVDVGTYNRRETLEFLKQEIKERSNVPEERMGLLHVKAAKNRFDSGSSSIEKTKLHAKSIMVDDQYVYVGSQNLYYDLHAEYGLVVKSKSFANKFRQNFWLKLFGGLAAEVK